MALTNLTVLNPALQNIARSINCQKKAAKAITDSEGTPNKDLGKLLYLIAFTHEHSTTNGTALANALINCCKINQIDKESLEDFLELGNPEIEDETEKMNVVGGFAECSSHDCGACEGEDCKPDDIPAEWRLTPNQIKDILK
ncbi:hypothetical protein DID76_02145 [Candidatus Marinamargulisbacteria bacterium SCGC AG-414-C22]|nr:hypothetical protein DID76_02145 [Candidatus Marinamargulisbacteria bacterium SCGC AG-414-C22]